MVPTRNAEATQKRLMDAALELYGERGYAGSCLDAILERASSSKGAFYHHFQSKEDLTARALELHWESWLAQLAAGWEAGRTPAERLAGLLAGLEPCGPGEVCCPLGLLGFESGSLPEQVRLALRAGLRLWSQEIGGMLLELGCPERERAESLAEQLLACYEGGVLMSRIGGSCRPLRQSLELWRKQVLEQVAAPSS